ncbi:F-box protein [Sporobolomyces salmoneus]|uniref:F-box protein n=1 Tax=Sporobolomyces salmoneus TaxID=183962 RepID=UPI00316FC262
MAKTSLPTELLEEILSRDLDQNELALISRSSKLLSTIAKPLLYRSILIQSRRQLDQFVAGARREDIATVKAVEIVGKGNASNTREMVGVECTAETVGHGQEWEMEGGCVEELVKGSVKLTEIESICVYNVVENPSYSQYVIVFSTFANLKDLSIVSYRHRGGIDAATGLLKRQYLPKLERLAVCDIMANTSAPPSRPSHGGTRPSAHFLRPPQVHLLPHLERHSDLLGQLKLLVSPSSHALTSCLALIHPAPVHLTVLNQSYPLLPSSKYAIVYISTRPSAANEVVAVFNDLSSIVTNFANYSLEYLALPPTFEGRLLDSEILVLENLKSLGVAIHFDGELGRSIAPPSFFDHLEKKKQEEEDSRNAMDIE